MKSTSREASKARRRQEDSSPYSSGTSTRSSRLRQRQGRRQLQGTTWHDSNDPPAQRQRGEDQYSSDTHSQSSLSSYCSEEFFSASSDLQSTCTEQTSPGGSTTWFYKEEGCDFPSEKFAYKHPPYSASADDAEQGGYLVEEDPDLKNLQRVRQASQHLVREFQRFVEVSQSEKSRRCREEAIMRIRRQQQWKRQEAVTRNSSALLDLQRRLARLKEDNIEEMSQCLSLQERLCSHRSRALHHDGHFQVMDDPHNRDKLVQRFRQLYDTADAASLQLEHNVLPEHAHFIEERSSAYFNFILQVAFRTANDLFSKLQERALQSVVVGVHGQAAIWNDQHTPGLACLTREWLREQSETSISNTSLSMEVQHQAEQHDFHKMLLGFMKQSRKTSAEQKMRYNNVVTSFIGQCLELAWRCTLQPRPLEVHEPEVGSQFEAEIHCRHATSTLGAQVISEVFWPGLVCSSNQPFLVLQKAIVKT